MVKVCYENGDVVCEFATFQEYKQALPNGLDADNIEAGFFVDFSALTLAEAQQIAWDKEDAQRKANRGMKTRRFCRD